MKSLRLVVGVLLLVGGIGLTAAGLVLLLQPNEYKSVVLVKISPPPSNSNSYNGYDPYFLLTEFEVFKSHAVLGNVVASLNLKELWAKKYNHGRILNDSETEEIIKKHLDLRNIRNSQLIEISAFDDDPSEAAKLANAIAQSYCKFRAEEFQHLAAEAANSNRPLNFQPPSIISVAIPQMRPVRPNRYLAGSMLGCGALLAVVGVLIFNSSES